MNTRPDNKQDQLEIGSLHFFSKNWLIFYNIIKKD